MSFVPVLILAPDEEICGRIQIVLTEEKLVLGRDYFISSHREAIHGKVTSGTPQVLFVCVLYQHELANRELVSHWSSLNQEMKKVVVCRFEVCLDIYDHQILDEGEDGDFGHSLSLEVRDHLDRLRIGK